MTKPSRARRDRSGLILVAAVLLVMLGMGCYRPTVEIELVVLSSKDGRPVSGADIIVGSRGWGRAEYLVWDREYSVRGVTDEKGGYRATLRSAPLGLPSGGQQPHAVRIHHPDFDSLYTTIQVQDGRLNGRLLMDPMGVALEERRRQQEAAQQIREAVLRYEADRIAVEIAIKQEAAVPSSLSLEVRLGNLLCERTQIEIEHAGSTLRWDVSHRKLLECYVSKSGVTGGAMADVYLAVDANIQGSDGSRGSGSIREELKLELDFTSDDPAEHRIALAATANRL